MGRLFQYNRLGGTNDAASNKDTTTQKDNFKRKEQTESFCPAYAELYPNLALSTENDLKIRKKTTQWIGSNLMVSLANHESLSCVHRNKTEKESSVESIKKTKIYNCMREFLRRKFFQQQTKIENTNKKSKNLRKEIEVTSDYDELDILDSSYNADEEDEEFNEDCDCKVDAMKQNAARKVRMRHTRSSDNPITCSPLRSALSFSSCWQQSNESARLSSIHSTDSDTDNDDYSHFKSAEAQQRREERKEQLENDAFISDDAGISDCCQLITKSGQYKRPHSAYSSRKVKKSYGKRQRRFVTRVVSNTSDEVAEDSDDLAELLETSWYQPRITTKAVYERLEQSSPGSFLVRRKARTFELCLRSETKVKQFTVVGNSNETYKLKGAKKQFPSLKALVTHHSVMSEQLPLTLALPREQEHFDAMTATMRQRCADDFDTYESLQILGILQNLQTKNFDS